ncbi:hypothetical protein [Ruegeria jejuensis]|uniref:hypothetical protein n=1 Tax=Ruegeria jejuensis TaxID=3233338 RepID=UPI00355AD173
MQIITGTDERDFLEGTSEDEVIIGGAGNDQLDGRGGSDIFVFGDDHGGDTILGFGNNDRLDVSQITGVNSIEDLSITSTGLGTILVDIGDGNSIVLPFVNPEQLTEARFIFADGLMVRMAWITTKASGT